VLLLLYQSFSYDYFLFFYRSLMRKSIRLNPIIDIYFYRLLFVRVLVLLVVELLLELDERVFVLELDDLVFVPE